MKCVIGIEPTAHTFGVGVLDVGGKILSNVWDFYATKEDGVIPMEVRVHYARVCDNVFEKALREAGILKRFK